MAITGIIAEFNPLHKGHKALIDYAHSYSAAVYCVISGNFVQRGDAAILPKLRRAEAALRCGADLVAELPVLWSMSTAQNFALGGVSQLMALGCDDILFGSESGNIDALIKAADLLETEELNIALTEELANGATFAKARENAAKRLGLDSDILSSPNDTLAIEYILAARRLGFNGSFHCFKRIGAPHDSAELNPLSVSASMIRQRLKQNNFGFAERFMPIELRGFLKEEFISDISRLETAILASLRAKPKEFFDTLPDLSEGLQNRLYLSIQNATGLEQLLSAVKTKRYSLARIRRLILSAFLELDGSYFGKRPPYVRVLGFNEKGSSLPENSKTPIVTQISDIKKLDESSLKVFDTECRATDLYSLSLFSPRGCGDEYKMKLLKTECLK